MSVEIYGPVKRGERGFAPMWAAKKPKSDEWKMAQIGVVTQYIQSTGEYGVLEGMDSEAQGIVAQVKSLIVKEATEAEKEAAYQRLLAKERAAQERRARQAAVEAIADKEEAHRLAKDVRRELKVQAAARNGQQPYSRVQARGRRKQKGSESGKGASTDHEAMERELAEFLRKAGL